jgi:membrane protein
MVIVIIKATTGYIIVIRSDIMEKLRHSDNTIIQIILSLIEKNDRFNLPDRSAMITYYLLLSIGPFLVLTFSLLSYFLAGNMDSVIGILEHIYEDARLIAEPILKYLDSTNDSTFAIVGGLATLFSSSKASQRLIESFHLIFGVEEREGIVAKGLFIGYSMLFTFALLISLVIFFVFFISGDPIVTLVDFLFGFKLDTLFLWNFVKNFAPVIYLLIFLTIIYKLLPNFRKRHKISIKESFLGAVFVTVGWIIGSGLFSFYIKNLNQNNAMYGVLGSIMVLMLWFYLLIYMLLLGGILITSHTEVKERIKWEDI